jgi:metal-responsive CopG/Arc/MetJ family transcriptional regulator
MAMAETTVQLPAELMHEVQKAAAEQQRSISEVLTDAARLYLGEQQWQRITAAAEQRARAQGLTEDDVPRLVEEARRERREQNA